MTIQKLCAEIRREAARSLLPLITFSSSSFFFFCALRSRSCQTLSESSAVAKNQKRKARERKANFCRSSSSWPGANAAVFRKESVRGKCHVLFVLMAFRRACRYLPPRGGSASRIQEPTCGSRSEFATETKEKKENRPVLTLRNANKFSLFLSFFVFSA